MRCRETSHGEPPAPRRRLPLGAPLTGARDGGREVRQDPRSLRSRRRFGSPAKRALPCDGTREGCGMAEVGRADGRWRGAIPCRFRDWRGGLRNLSLFTAHPGGRRDPVRASRALFAAKELDPGVRRGEREEGTSALLPLREKVGPKGSDEGLRDGGHGPQFNARRDPSSVSLRLPPSPARGEG